jgi:hypothetical protein
MNKFFKKYVFNSLGLITVAYGCWLFFSCRLLYKNNDLFGLIFLIIFLYFSHVIAVWLSLILLDDLKDKKCAKEECALKTTNEFRDANTRLVTATLFSSDEVSPSFQLVFGFIDFSEYKGWREHFSLCLEDEKIFVSDSDKVSSFHDLIKSKILLDDSTISQFKYAFALRFAKSVNND